MPENKLIYLGNRIRNARKDCGLTQQELADQTGLAVKTIQDIEKGRKNTTYETLALIIERLGISANILFPSKTSAEDEEIQRFIGKFQTCTPESRKVLLNTLDCLAEQLLTFQHSLSAKQSD